MPPKTAYDIAREHDDLPELPCYELRHTKDGIVGLFNRAEVTPKGSGAPSGQDMVDLLGMPTKDTDDRIVGVRVNNEQGGYVDWGVSDLHRPAIRMPCGDDGVEVLEHYKRISTTAWLLTGGDMSKMKEGPFRISTRRGH